jgi:hypothetical protein
LVAVVILIQLYRTGLDAHYVFDEALRVLAIFGPVLIGHSEAQPLLAILYRFFGQLFMGQGTSVASGFTLGMILAPTISAARLGD